MKWSILFAVALSCVFVLIVTPAFAGQNAGAVIVLSPGVIEADTLSYRVLLSSLVETRVVHLIFLVPEDLVFLSWEDGPLIAQAIRIGPYFDKPTRRLLVALGATTRHPVTRSSGEVGTLTLLRAGDSDSQVRILEASLTDDSLREDWLVTPEDYVSPSPRPGMLTGDELPAKFVLRSVGPNPITRRSTIRFDIPHPGARVRIAIYDVVGREIRRLVDTATSPGYHSHEWDLTDDRGQMLAPGVYFCRMEAGDFSDTKKIVLLR